jgi:hypothetical protein
MTPPLQTLVALVIVALAAAWLLWRALGKKKSPGCGGDCGCPTDELKAKLKR